MLGTGRSGTQLLTGLLNQSDQGLVFHEPNFGEDVSTMEDFRLHPVQAASYWKSFRQYQVYKRLQENPSARVYGEVNGTIRYQAPAILGCIPDATLFLLARDGRGVVRSVMRWPQFYGPESRGAYALAPLPGDPYEAEWDRMSRFEKICWGWREANEFMMRDVPPENWLQLEKLTTDYDYFKTSLLGKLGLSIPYETWLAAVSKRSSNATSEYAFPAWDDWTDQQQSDFDRICGNTMDRLGYVFRTK